MFCVATGFADNDTSLISKNNSRAWTLRNVDIDSAIVLSKQSLALINKLDPSTSYPKNWKEKTLARTYYYLGIFYHLYGESKLSFEYFKKALKISTEVNDDYGKSQVYGGLGHSYMLEGNLSRAAENYFKALAIYEKMDIKSGVAIQLSNLGNVFAEQRLSDKALGYYFRSLKIAKQINDSMRMAIQLGNIGTVYSEQKKNKQAIDYYLKALEMNELIKNKSGIAMNLNNIGSLYQDEENYETSLPYYEQALKLSEEYGNKDHIASFTGNIGIVYMLQKKFKIAEVYELRALKLSQEIQSINAIRDIESSLSDLYSAWGKEKQAFEHYKAYIRARDTLVNASNTEQNVRLEMNYEFEKKQAIDNAIHREQLQVLEAENKTQKQFRLFLFVILGLAIVLVFVLRRSVQNKTRIATFLAEEAQRKETLLQEVHHRINNNLQIISSLLTLQANNVADERLFDYLKQSQTRIQSLSVLHELLYQQDSHLEIDMKDYLNRVLDFHRDVLATKLQNVEMKVNVNSFLFPTKVAVPIALIINELVTNAIKYAFNEKDQGSITISLSPSDNLQGSWVLQIKDSGKGMPANLSAKKESLGLRLVTIMAKQIGAVLTKVNSPGATFTLIFSTEK